MSRKTIIAIAVLAVLLGLSMATASLVGIGSTATTTAIITSQLAVGQIGPLVPEGPQFAGYNIKVVNGVPTDTNIHVTVAGAGPLSGSYVAHSAPPSGPGRDLWEVRIHGAQAQGFVHIQRIADNSQSPPAIIWQAEAACGIPGGDNGASSGHLANGLVFGGAAILNGQDFNCSGSTGWFGSPAFGGNGTVTFTVSP